MTASLTDGGSELVTLARERIAELELDLHRWRRVLALAASTDHTTPRPVKPVAAPARSASPIQCIIGVVADRYGVTPEALIAHERTQPATTARQVAMRLARELTGKSYPTIGRAFDRDHATVIHACEVTASFALGDLRDELVAALHQPPAAPAASTLKIAG